MGDQTHFGPISDISICEVKAQVGFYGIMWKINIECRPFIKAGY